MSAVTGYEIRHVAPGEIDVMMGLLRVFAEAFDDHERYLRHPPGDAYLARLLGKPDFIAIVALAERRVVGGLTAYVLEKPEMAGSEVYIYDLAVLEPHRRRKIATRLIRTLQDMVGRLGAYVVFVQADLEDAPAIALYESLGTRESVYHFDIDVPVAPPRPSISRRP